MRTARTIKPVYIIGAVAGRMGWLLFAASLTLSEPVVTTIVFEFWPVFFAVFTLSRFWRALMFDGQRVQRSEASRTLLLLAVGGVGVSLTVLSDASAATWSVSDFWGVLFAVLSAVAAAGGGIVEQMMPVDPKRSIGSSNPTDVSAAGAAVAQLLIGSAIVAVALVWWPLSSVVRLGWGGVLCAVGAAVVQISGNWLFQHANHLARSQEGQASPRINSLYYLTPVGAALLLLWLADTDILRWDLFVAGTAGVIVVNMVLHLDPEGAEQSASGSGGQGYRALILSLWAAGAAVLFRDDYLPEVWRVWSVVEYWAMIGVCATVFTLILAFRQSRLAELRRDMDALMLQVHQRIAFMGECGDLSQQDADEAAGWIQQIDTARKPHELSEAYFDLRKLLLNRMDAHADRDHAERLSRLLADVEVLVNLRQQGRNFTELAVLNLLAYLTVALAITARPASEMAPFASWVHDTTAMVIAAVFSFLAFDLMDKRRNADSPTLCQVTDQARQLYGQPPGWRLELVAYRDRAAERVLASLLGVVLLVGAVIMLGIKWM